MAVSAIQDVRTRCLARPSVAELIERARTIGLVAREKALETEQRRHVSAELIGMMRDAELFRLMQPERFGGFEYGYEVFVELVAAIGAGDGSTGWVYSLGAVHPWLIACYPDEAQKEVWSQDRDAIAAVSYAPAGKAVPDKDGYRLTGRFSFASGVDNANWGIVGGMLPLKEGPKPGFFLVPRSQFSIHDDWFTMGLAGTEQNHRCRRSVHPGLPHCHIRRHAHRQRTRDYHQSQPALSSTNAGGGATLPRCPCPGHGARRARGLQGASRGPHHARCRSRWQQQDERIRHYSDARCRSNCVHRCRRVDDPPGHS